MKKGATRFPVVRLRRNATSAMIQTSTPSAGWITPGKAIALSAESVQYPKNPTDEPPIRRYLGQANPVIKTKLHRYRNQGRPSKLNTLLNITEKLSDGAPPALVDAHSLA